MFFESLILPLCFLIGSSALSGVSRSLQALSKSQVDQEVERHPSRYFFAKLVQRFFRSSPTSLLYLNGITKQITRILYATTSCLYFLTHPYFAQHFYDPSHTTIQAVPFLLAIAAIVVLCVAVDFCGILIGSFFPFLGLRLFYPIAELFLTVFSPLSFFLLWMHGRLSGRRSHRQTAPHPAKIKDKLIELVRETESGQMLDPQDQRLILSVASFRDRIVREIMVPRINVLFLSKEETIEKAARLFVQEGYSRIPIFDQTFDHIIGVLLYKDILTYYQSFLDKKSPAPGETDISSLIKPIIYTPETKRIGQLLQEFCAKQVHMAIVVNEYGGTEGLVTIEDILEEIVGEIGDEFDDEEDQERLFVSAPGEGWIVDARMNIVDIEKELKISIPNSPEYDTIGGYIFHAARAIPPQGWKLHHDQFDLEVLSSSERAIEKIKITHLSKN